VGEVARGSWRIYDDLYVNLLVVFYPSIGNLVYQRGVMELICRTFSVHTIVTAN